MYEQSAFANNWAVENSMIIIEIVRLLLSISQSNQIIG